MVQAVGDIVIIKHIATPEIPQEMPEEAPEAPEEA
jgi:hypothetical protein